MGSYIGIFVVYILGGLTFPLLVLGSVLLHAYLIFPRRDTNSSVFTELPETLEQPGDDRDILRSETRSLPDKFKARSHEADVAAGYFAVCREYVPGGVNGKPLERTSPAGTVVATESPSVYQSMYRSIFDRHKSPTIDQGKNVKRARNVFYVILRYVRGFDAGLWTFVPTLDRCSGTVI